MSEENEQKAATEATDAPESEPGKAEGTEEADTPGQGETGKDFVQFPDGKLEARFKRIYGHMKENERVISQLAEDNKKLIDKINQIDAAGNQTAVNSQLGKLREAKRSALEAQDYDKVMQLDEQIMDLKAAGIKKAEPIKPAVEETPQSQFPSGWESRFVEWSAEIDETGNYLRPWAANANHPLHVKAVKIASEILQNGDQDDIDVVLEEVEKRMKGPVKPRPAAVLSSDKNVTTNSAKKISLTDVQKRVAQAMFPDKSPAEAQAAYIQGMS